MDYKPYTLEWSRKRYLNEAIQKYFDSGVEAETIVCDIVDCLVDSASFHTNRAEKIQCVIELIKGIKNE